MSSKFIFRSGCRISGVDAETAGLEMQRINNEVPLTAAAVVKWAKPKNSLLHEAFEWDDGIAANLYRLNRARNLIRAIQVISEDPESEAVSVYVHVSDCYEDINVIAGNPELYDLALAELKAKMAGATRAVKELEKAVALLSDKSKQSTLDIPVKKAAKAIKTARAAVGVL